MTLSDVLREVVGKLRPPSDFEAGCDDVLEALRQRLSPPLGERGATLARGSVHLRSELEGYRALVVREFGGDPPPSVEPSATVWSLVERRDAAIVVDLGTGRGVVIGDGSEVELPVIAVAHEPSASVQQMLAREATHVIALPLRAASGLAGMVSIELAWPAQLGLPLEREVPFQDAETIVTVAGPLLASLSPREPADAVLGTSDPLFPVVGARTRPLLRMLDLFVRQDETLLLTGPTGAGKSRLAEWCHARSVRRDGPFAVANLLAVPESMQMAELFGWRRGAFTGALADHEGVVAAADGGTLFLDEIDKLTLAAQAGMLRLLETRRFSPLGAARERSVDARFIVATNADLRELVERGLFREDLYYRVNVLPVRLEPLSERVDEVAGWANVMLERRHREARGSGDARFSDEAVRSLCAYRWPGNLRQLDNVVRRAFALGHARDERADGSLHVGGEAVRRALELEGALQTAASTPVGDDLLRAVGESLLDHAIALRRDGGTLPLEALDVLRGAALRAAVERLGSVKDAYLLFGGDALVETRNHQAAYRRELAALRALEEGIGRREP